MDIVSLNEGEAYLLSGQDNIAQQKPFAMGPSVVIIKRGEYGACLFTPAGVFLAPAYLVDKVVDPTGAGDSFAGAFMGYLAEAGADREMAKANPERWESILRRAVLAGCVMASFTVEDFSIYRLMRLENEELVARQHKMLKMLAI